jgi:hypothetical protein
MNYFKKSVIFIALLTTFNSCKKDPIEALLEIFVKHTDYNTFMATNVSVKSIIIDNNVVPLDFDGWSNITLNETRQITVKSEVERNDFEVKVIVAGSGSDIAMEYITNGVADGDILDLDLANNSFSIRNGGNSGGGSEASCSQYWMPGGDCLDLQGNPGIKIKLCKQSETNSQISVKAHFEPNNQGIDQDYYAEVKMYAGDSQNKIMTINDFNKNGWISNAFSMDKTITTATGELAIWSDQENVHIGVNSGIKYYGSVGFAACFR